MVISLTSTLGRFQGLSSTSNGGGNARASAGAKSHQGQQGSSDDAATFIRSIESKIAAQQTKITTETANISQTQGTGGAVREADMASGGDDSVHRMHAIATMGAAKLSRVL